MMRNPPRTILPAAGFLLLLLAVPAGAQPEMHKDPLSYDRRVRQFFEAYCWKCHNSERRKGEVNLKAFQDPGMIIRSPKLWRKVYQMLRDRKMPPEDARDLPEDKRELMVNFVGFTLNSVNCEDFREPGRPQVRRLTGAEYNNSISALFGRKLRPADDLPPDPTGYGFDTIAEALRLSPVRVDQCYAVSKRLLEGLPDGALVARPGRGVSELEAARRNIIAFATKAFRRPVGKERAERYLEIFRKARSGGADFEGAMRPMFLAVLLSPRFLLRAERNRPGVEEPYLVDDYDMASRLSYFLWSGPPDGTLLALAARGKLNDPVVLERQVKRMLADPRSRQLAENFVGQWLQLRAFERHRPDAKEFPRFTESLRRAMLDEVVLFVTDIIRKDRSAYDFLNSDRTFLNEELARVYGIGGIRGPEMRPVRLADPRRGGLLGMAAILTLTSDPTRTNIPRRGNYILSTFLGTPPPPPPPEVPPLEESRKGGGVQTVRAMLEEHRRRPECASCHAKIDPPGFALETFDAIGQWRERDEGFPIDASGEMEGGVVIDGPLDLRMVLLARREEFLRTFSERMMIYALGRGLEYTDECVVDDMLEAAQAKEGRFSALVVALVRSFPFRYRRNPDF